MSSPWIWDQLRKDYYIPSVNTQGLEKRTYNKTLPRETISSPRPHNEPSPSRPDTGPREPPVRDGYKAPYPGSTAQNQTVMPQTASRPASQRLPVQDYAGALEPSITYGAMQQPQSMQTHVALGAVQSTSISGRAQSYRINLPAQRASSAYVPSTGPGFQPSKSQKQIAHVSGYTSTAYPNRQSSRSTGGYHGTAPQTYGLVSTSPAYGASQYGSCAPPVATTSQQYPHPARSSSIPTTGATRGPVSTQPSAGNNPTHAATDHLTTLAKKAGRDDRSSQAHRMPETGQFDSLIEDVANMGVSTPRPHQDSRTPQKPSVRSPTASLIPQPRPYSIYGSGSDYQKADSPRRFFVIGRVVQIFHIEPASEMRGSHRSSNYYTTVAHNGIAYHDFRRFIVVRLEQGLNHCYAVPIATYGGRGATNPYIDPSAHAVAYIGDKPPHLLTGEEISKDPIRIKPAARTEKLDDRSRINFRKIEKIDHGWRVRNVGMVDETSKPKLLAYYREHNHNS